MLAWRFDQGRLDCLQVDEIKRIACALAQIDGAKKPGKGEPDTVRLTLEKFSSLQFKPSNYYVWRNYGRVFECMMLATAINGHIFVTDLCRTIAANPEEIDSDDYLAHFARNFYYSSPIFEDYTPNGLQIFPVVAIIKFLISECIVQGKNRITVDEVGNYLIANNVTGLENLSHFAGLKKKALFAHTDLRQVRELIKVISQFSFLKWDDPNLYLEVSNTEELYAIETSLKPIQNMRKKNAGEEILQMGQTYAATSLGTLTLNNIESNEEEFTEGKKVRVTHLRSERSAKLKSFYFAKIKHPELCRMCQLDTAKKYPWTQHVIELHHLLPLASPVRVEHGTTSIKDLVGLCPSCHRATHRFYSVWFKKNKVKDFRNYGEAVAVYEEAKAKIVIV
jgi:hypothetical protein